MISLNLPWPPSINHYWRHTKNGHYISNKGKKYRQDVYSLCLGIKGRFDINDRLSISIDAYPPDRRKRDIDNVLKSLLDALQHAGIYQDDGQIDQLFISRNSALEGRVAITIGNLETPI